MTELFDTYVNSILEACWKKYKKVGMKKKGKKMVPDCVLKTPVKESSDEILSELTQKLLGKAASKHQNISGMNDYAEERKNRFVKKTIEAAIKNNSLIRLISTTGGSEKAFIIEEMFINETDRDIRDGYTRIVARGKILLNEYNRSRYVSELELDEKDGLPVSKDKNGKPITIHLKEEDFLLTHHVGRYHLTEGGNPDSDSFYLFLDKEDAVRFVQKAKKMTGQIIPWIRLPIKSKTVNESWQDEKHKNPSGGMKKSGVDAYRRENPGSKLQTAVTTDPSKLKKDSKPAKRRKSFCSRMKGLKKKLTSAKTANDPDSRVNKSLRKWNC
jgi:hypothetical protein